MRVENFENNTQLRAYFSATNIYIYIYIYIYNINIYIYVYIYIYIYNINIYICIYIYIYIYIYIHVFIWGALLHYLYLWNGSVACIASGIILLVTVISDKKTRNECINEESLLR